MCCQSNFFPQCAVNHVFSLKCAVNYVVLKNMISSRFWEKHDSQHILGKNMIGSTFWEKNIIDSTLWEKV
jgi:hypothetical protein